MKLMSPWLQARVILFLATAGLSAQALALTPSIEMKADGFRNESALSIVAANGNSRNQTFNFAQKNGYKLDAHTVKGEYVYLRSQSADVESARNWGAALRYERLLSPRLSLYFGQGLESDPFAGIDLRYDTDAGLRYALITTDQWSWFVEAGYRYMNEGRSKAPDVFEQLGRTYSELSWKINETTSLKHWVEFLPNMTRPDGYLMNTEVSLNAILTSVLSLKVAYLLKHNNAPPPGTTIRDDTLVSTALVASF